MFTAKWFVGLFSGVMFIISILISPFVTALFAPQVNEAALGYGLFTLYIMAGVLALVLLALPFMVHFGKTMREFTSGLAFPLLLTSLGVSILSIIWGQGFNWVTFVAGCGLLSSLYAIIRAWQQRQILHVSAV